MYLKRMELVGFKSFADRTELEFVPGVTAVVGPNGSGKSNISDAIRWVLGEQSAKSLRGAKMEDVIFAGSDSRKPVNYCEVSLTLDNSDHTLPLDYHEVTVTRRVYRSGEGEYFINKQPCRLKDIVELFMDTGLGKEAYSIIGQGRIDEILSNKAEDRRGIFEEAAGIVKYKARKREAEKKLEETAGNLIRIGDIIGELENQIGPMFEQAEAAKRYKQLKEQMQNLEISLCVHDIEELHDRWQQETAKKMQLQDEHAAQSTLVASLESQLEESRWQAEQLDKLMEASNRQHVEVVAEYEKAEGRREVLQERHRNLLTGRDDLQAVIAKLAVERESKTVQVAQEKEKLAELAAKRDGTRRELESKLSVSKDFLDRSRLEAEVERLKADLIELLNETAGKRNELKHIETNKSGLQRRSEKLQEDEAELRERIRALDESFASGQLTLADMRKQEQALLKRLEELRRFTANRTAEKERLLATLRQLQTEKASFQSRYELLCDMQQEYGGFSQGVRSILQAAGKGRVHGICGAVAELIHVPAQYETAIETALGGALQNVVVETEKAGREAILYLKASGGGRATFLPLDVMKGRLLGRSERMVIEGHSGYVGIAAEMVDFAEKYRPITEYLLGQVVIAKTIGHANALARLLQYRVRIVTLDGDVVNPGGAMTGGSQQKKGTSILGRQREIEELEHKLKALNGKLSELQQQLDAFESNARQAEQEQQTLAEQIEQERTQIHSVEAQIRELGAQRQAVQERLQLVLLEREQYEKELAEWNRKEEVTRAELAGLDEQVKELSAKVDGMQAKLKEQQSVQADISEEVTELKVRLAALDQEIAATKANVDRLEKELAVVAAELAAKQGELQTVGERIKETSRELEEAAAQLSLLERRRVDAQQALQAELSRKQELQKRIADEEHKAREARLVLKNLENQLHQVEVRVNRLDVELNNMLTRLATDYHISFELAKQRYPVPQDIAGAQQQVASLRRQIESLGDVNLGAIEEYERMQERLGFLTSQHDDLLEARDKLNDVIAEIDQEMSKRFKETFEAIRGQFHLVFSRLFGGGRADLILVDPDNLLTTGIDIVAQPPGKKLQNLGLLSGGERALTAMALLFSILHVKPVPFCVLDEVEAALDEANVARFAEYMREFSSQTQFICITHRKGTMEYADVLYGVTMQESGISKIVSVKLVEEDVVQTA
ncbi:chromosome segregation protein SMC [Effusibacillus pohliae]|uniref:chromosome segregation protein SMC n=1 Tax=Effusibacillus pohliae TaxID=232270 RepID=UPI0003608A43|nr:chromosome segregation protein SMC [Effusibacillus pohliae]